MVDIYPINVSCSGLFIPKLGHVPPYYKFELFPYQKEVLNEMYNGLDIPQERLADEQT